MFNAIDLFCGAGGLSCGLQQADSNIALGVDIDKAALTTYQNNFPSTQIIEDDIKNVTTEQIIKETDIFPKSNFLLAGCPPCQGFSLLGKRNPKDEKNKLVFQYIRLIEELQPTFILMENVPGMNRNIGKDIFLSVIKRLEKKYYLEYDILNAADYGVPQTRKRLVLHGVRKDIYVQLNAFLINQLFYCLNKHIVNAAKTHHQNIKTGSQSKKLSWFFHLFVQVKVILVLKKFSIIKLKIYLN